MSKRALLRFPDGVEIEVKATLTTYGPSKDGEKQGGIGYEYVVDEITLIECQKRIPGSELEALERFCRILLAGWDVLNGRDPDANVIRLTHGGQA